MALDDMGWYGMAGVAWNGMGWHGMTWGGIG